MHAMTPHACKTHWDLAASAIRLKHVDVIRAVSLVRRHEEGQGGRPSPSAAAAAGAGASVVGTGGAPGRSVSCTSPSCTSPLGCTPLGCTQDCLALRLRMLRVCTPLCWSPACFLELCLRWTLASSCLSQGFLALCLPVRVIANGAY